MHILSPVTDNCPSWISRRERMAVEIFSWPNLHERMFGGREDLTRDCPHTRRTRIRSSYRARLLWLIPKIGFWLTSHKIIWKINCFFFLLSWIWLIQTHASAVYCQQLFYPAICRAGAVAWSVPCLPGMWTVAGSILTPGNIFSWILVMK